MGGGGEVVCHRNVIIVTTRSCTTLTTQPREYTSVLSVMVMHASEVVPPTCAAAPAQPARSHPGRTEHRQNGAHSLQLRSETRAHHVLRI